MDLEWYQYVIAIVGGAIAGAINTLAGNGSAITLTILTEVIGLDGNLANGTNRVGVFTQSAAGTFAFYKNGRLQISHSKLYIILTIIGAIAGIWVATMVSNEQFRFVFTVLLVLMFFVILVKPKRWLIETDLERKPSLWISIPLFLAIGFYGGFIQMGMGVFFLAIMVLVARYSLIDSNAVKLVVVAAYTILALLIFHWKGLIDWEVGAILAIGQTTGGYLMANFASKYKAANVWAHRLLVVIVVFAMIKVLNIHSLIYNLL